MDLGLKGKIALVAGASAGLGLAAARVLFEEGARVAICSSDPDKIENAAISLSGDKSLVLPVVCDLTKADQIEKLVASVNAAFGSVDIVVTNCGGPPLGQHDTIGEEEWLLGYNKTFMSAIRLIDQVLPGMKERKFGRIILSTSSPSMSGSMMSSSTRSGRLLRT